MTTLDAKSALLVVDLQKGIVGAQFVDPIDKVIGRTSALIREFRKHKLPVVLINVAGSAPGRTEQPPYRLSDLPADFTDFVPELDRQPTDLVVTKRTWGAFTHTGLEDRLKSLDVTQVVVTGVSTGTGVEATARQAYEAGFNVTLAIDAMTDRRAEAHAYSLGNVFPRLGETGTVEDVIELLSQRSV